MFETEKIFPEPQTGIFAPADFSRQPQSNDTPLPLSLRERQMHAVLGQYAPELLRDLVDHFGGPLLLLSTETIRRQYGVLQQLLPRVKHHFALKPLPHADAVKAVQSLGGYFDLASSGEVELLESSNIDASSCIHSHPIKRHTDVERALRFGIDTFVFDNSCELRKLLPFRSKIRLMLRLAFPNKQAQCDLSAKFGVRPEEAMALLREARELGFELRGLCFHVGSQMPTPEKHVEAIRAARILFDQAAAAGIPLRLLDIGGGFPVPYTEEIMPIEAFAAPIRYALDELFPDTEIFSEPGRFICGPAVTLVSSVIGKTVRNGQKYYYLDDGIYNSYSGILFDHGAYPVFSLREAENPTAPMYPSTLAGPTCDSIDVMYTNLPMPELHVGDLLISPMMGAYAGASHATDFNHILRPKMLTIDPM